MEHDPCQTADQTEKGERHRHHHPSPVRQSTPDIPGTRRRRGARD